MRSKAELHGARRAERRRAELWSVELNGCGGGSNTEIVQTRTDDGGEGRGGRRAWSPRRQVRTRAQTLQ